MSDEIKNRKVARRRLLRRAGTVAAGLAGASAVSGVISTPAQAAPGGNMIIGAANDAGSNQTSLTNNSAANPSLTLTNNAITASGPLDVGGPQLRLNPNGDYVSGPVGTVGMSADGTLWSVVPGASGGSFPDFVRTGANSTIVQSFSPVRMLDTRPGEGGMGGAINPEVVDGSGFIQAGQTLHLSLDTLIVFGWSIFANITVVAGVQAGGYVTAFPTGAPQPLASNLNIFAPNQIVANFALVGLGSTPSVVNAISIFASSPTKVIVDVSGVVVNYSSDINLPGGAGMAAAQSAPARVRPAHLSGQ